MNVRVLLLSQIVETGTLFCPTTHFVSSLRPL